jgi:cytochrome c biogenesis protein CcmG/thiol:disulfide interchange protein DsbE
MKQAAWVIVAFALLGSLIFAMFKGFGKNPREVPFELLGRDAPAFSMPTLDGGQLSLEALRGRPIVINFWSSWCGPCAEEAPALEMSFRKWGQKVAFVGVVFEDSETNARNFLRRHPASYPQLFSPVSTMAIDYAVTGVPETYFLNEQGRIIGKYPAPILSAAQFDFLLLDSRMRDNLQQNPKPEDVWLKELLLNPSGLEDAWLKEVLHQNPGLKEFWLLNVLHRNPKLKDALLKDAQMKEALSKNPNLRMLFQQGDAP